MGPPARPFTAIGITRLKVAVGPDMPAASRALRSAVQDRDVPVDVADQGRGFAAGRGCWAASDL
jgi:hypothetical protein